MPKYLVKSPLRHDGQDYEPGETVDLTKKQAEAMPATVEPVEKKAEPEKK